MNLYVTDNFLQDVCINVRKRVGTNEFRGGVAWCQTDVLTVLIRCRAADQRQSRQIQTSQTKYAYCISTTLTSCVRVGQLHCSLRSPGSDVSGAVASTRIIDSATASKQAAGRRPDRAGIGSVTSVHWQLDGINKRPMSRTTSSLANYRFEVLVQYVSSINLHISL